MKQITSQVSHDVAERLRTAMYQLQQIAALERAPLVDEPRPVGSILRGERDARVGEVVEFRQGRVDIGLLCFRRSRIRRRTAEQEQGHLGLRLAQLVQETLERKAQVNEKTAATPARGGKDINARHAVAQGKPRFADRLIDGVGMRRL